MSPQIALLSLGDHLPDPHTGAWTSQTDKFRLLVDQSVHAEAAGFDAVLLGEHHYCGYILSVPQLVLAAIAERTTTLRLNTGVTLLPTLDPVRVAEDFATLDVLSGGRAEVTVGRGILPSAYAAIGRTVDSSREVFAESAALLLRLLAEEDVTWEGQWRPPLAGITVQPRSAQRPHLPVWIGGGSSMASVDLAAELGCPLMLPGVFAGPATFVPFVERYRAAFAEHGHDPAGCRVGTVFHAHVAATTQAARRRWEPYYRAYVEFVDELWDDPSLFGTLSRRKEPLDLDQRWSTTAMVGSPAEVTERIAHAHELLDLDLIALSMDLGGLPRELLFETLDLVGDRVIPALRAPAET